MLIPLILILILTIGIIGGDIGATESLQAQREAFQRIERTLQEGIRPDYTALRTYPLYPYLRYRDLLGRLNDFPASEVRDFLQDYADSSLAGRLRNAWLRQLAGARRWDDLLRDFAPTRDLNRECWRRQALLATGQTDTALQGFDTFWRYGHSLPNDCNPVIALWQNQGNPSPELRWQRFVLAMQAGELGLARFLQTDMPDNDRERAETWLAVINDPTLILNPTRLKIDDPRSWVILRDGLQRWVRRDALAAAAALDQLKQRDPTLASQLADEERLLALWIASDYGPTALARLDALPETVVDRDVREWRIRVCLKQGDWTETLHQLNRLPPEERDSPHWQYWRGRALEALGQTEQAQQAYRAAASHRDFSGFLAADRLGIPYTIADNPLVASATELDVLMEHSPGLRRARELYILGREPEADAEWRQAIQGFDPTDLKRAALLAHRWEWHHQAIITIAQAEHWDDLALRFPLAYREGVINNAQADTIDPAWVYAVIRQESAFRPDARSPVGALGLMQLMPVTGAQIAQELQDATTTPDLLQPDINIRYGVRYLRRMLERLQGHPFLATAAYNAGPAKVMQWLPTSEPISADIWVETIPYRETRTYVWRVMEYAAVYRHLLGQDHSPSTTHDAGMKAVLPPTVDRQAG